MSKYKIGDKVIYKGIIGTVEGLTESFGGKPMLALVSEEYPELTCTAAEAECEQYDGEEYDQSEGISDARLVSARISNLGDSLTDKYFRDGQH